MRLRVIGGMTVRRDGQWFPVRAPKQRVLVAMLLVDLGSPVSMDLLVEELWPDRPPERPERQVHMLVWRLRRLFGDNEVLQTVRPGYRLGLEPDECDVGRFENLRARGQALLRTDQPAAAVELFREALELWRGPAYADVRATAAVESAAVRLEESRLSVAEALSEAELRLGRYEAAVVRLQGLVAEHPFRERLRGLQMTALHQSGRQAEALAVYQTIYRLLDDELGIRPGQELQRLQQRILSAGSTELEVTAGRTATDPLPADPSPVDPLPVDPPPAELAPRPAQLPPELASMIGRDAERAQLCAVAPAARSLTVIDGMPGVGKTTLAVHAAHRLADRFADGQLFVDLHGFSGVPPVSAQTALERLLRAVGVPGTRIPVDPEERAALWRTRTADRRYLIVLDNAASSEQVRTLLPGSTSCAVIVTSRLRLADLEDAQAITLRPLPSPEAVQLFRSLLGPDRIGDVPEALLEQTAQLCGLPLALRLLASRLRSRPGWAVDEVLHRMREDRRELVELDVGGRSVAAAFRISCDQLEPPDRRLFRLLGLHPGMDFDRHAAAALSGMDVRTVTGRLERLVDGHLLDARGYGRYASHDLVRAYAAELAAHEESEAERTEAVGRLLDYYLATAAAAMDAYAPAERHRRPDVPTVAVPPPWSDAVPEQSGQSGQSGQQPGRPERTWLAARRWLDTERANLVALAGHAVRIGRPDHTWRLSGCLHRYLQNGSYYSAAFELYDHHLRAARDSENPVEQGRALLNLGVTHYRTGDHAGAARLQRQALQCLPEEPRQDRAQVLYNLGLVLQATSDLRQARDCFSDAAVAFRSLRDTVGEARAASALARLSRLLGRYQEAETYGERALALTPEPDRQGVGLARFSLGMARRATGRYEQALEDLTEALRLRREIRNRLAEGAALAAIAGVLRGLARYRESLEHGREALRIAVELDDASGEVDALLEVGETLLVVGEPATARTELTRACELAQRLGQPPDLARARHALGNACQQLGDQPAAREHWQAALCSYDQLGMPEADQLRSLSDGH